MSLRLAVLLVPFFDVCPPPTDGFSIASVIGGGRFITSLVHGISMRYANTYEPTAHCSRVSLLRELGGRREARCEREARSRLYKTDILVWTRSLFKLINRALLTSHNPYISCGTWACHRQEVSRDHAERMRQRPDW